MKSRENRGITLIALTITIILLLILGGVVVSTFNNGNIVENSLSATEKAKVESMKENIQLAITGRIVKEDGNVTIGQIIDELEKKGWVESGNSNSENGQVKTKQDEYVYEIKQDSYGNWAVSYVGKGEIEEVKITLSANLSTTGTTNQVTITVTTKTRSGIKSIEFPDGTSKTYDSGTITVTEKYTVTKNGTYKFIATNNNGDSLTKQVVVDNILEGTIQISANPRTPTMGDVVITVKWPTGKYSTIQEISTNEGSSWSNYTGSQSQVTVSSNCTIKARVRNGSTEMKTVTLEVTNIDKNAPIVTAKQSSVTIKEGDSNDISNYFTVSKNGTAGIASITYADTSNSNAEISNTNTLSVGTHNIKCTANKETGASANATIIVVVESKDTMPPTLTVTCEVNGFYEAKATVTNVSDDVGMPDNPIFSYYLKGEDEADDKYVLKYQGTETTYTFYESTRGGYQAKVTVTDKAGNIGSATASFYLTACFVAGTQVLTENGLRNIEDIQVGDKVYAINIDNNERELKTVKETYITRTYETYTLTINDEKVTTTPRHQFYIVDKGWVRAYDLEVGDKIVAKYEDLTINQIEHDFLEKSIPVYNLTVDDFHTYLVTEYEVLVHNLVTPSKNK